MFMIPRFAWFDSAWFDSAWFDSAWFDSLEWRQKMLRRAAWTWRR
jgi:hypothetical protein